MSWAELSWVGTEKVSWVELSWEEKSELSWVELGTKIMSWVELELELNSTQLKYALLITSSTQLKTHEFFGSPSQLWSRNLKGRWEGVLGQETMENHAGGEGRASRFAKVSQIFAPQPFSGVVLWGWIYEVALFFLKFWHPMVFKLNSVFSSKSMEANVGQDTFSKFDYQKFSNGSQTFRTTYLGPLIPPEVITWVLGVI